MKSQQVDYNNVIVVEAIVGLVALVVVTIVKTSLLTTDTPADSRPASLANVPASD